MTWSDAAVVNSGIGLLEEALTGEPIEIVDAGGGTGVVESAALLAQTDLLDQRQDVTVASIRDEPGGGKKILLRITSKGVMEAYNMTQIGIWGTCGSKGRVLFALLQDQKGISIPTEASMPDFLLEFYAIVLVSGNVQFTYTVDPNALASVGDLQAAVGKMDDALREVVKSTEGKLSSAATSEEVASDDTFAIIPADGEGTKRVAFSVIIDSLKATLDPRYRVPEYDGLASFPAQGETGRLYVDTSTEKTYRWNGTGYVEVSKGVTDAEELGYIDNKKLNATNAQDAIDAVAQRAIDAADAAEEADKFAGEAKETADEAQRIAGEAQTAAGDAQKAADAALEAVTRLPHTIDAIPTQNGSLAYTGSAQTPSWNSYNPETLILGGVTTGTDAGTYMATFTPVEGYTWSDGTADTKSVPWSIGRASIAKVPSQSGSLTYNRAAQSPTWNDYNSAQITIGGTSSATDADTYDALFTPTKNYQWSDGTTEAKAASWTIGRAPIETTPTQSGSLTYTGNALTPSWSNYDSSQLTIGGTHSATNAGTYSASFTPTKNYMWSNGVTSAKSASWAIGKAAGSLSLNKTSLTLTDGTPTGAITVTRAGDGAISAVSSNTNIATVAVSGTTVTVTGKAQGSATITVSVAAGSNHNAPSDKTVTVTVDFPNVFGVVWNYASTSTALSRLTKTSDPNGYVTVNIITEPSPAVGTGAGSSPFDSYAPWKQMDEYNIINNAVSYKRGASGFSRTSYDTAVFIPEYYFKIVDDATNNRRYFYVADKAKAGFTKHPGSGKYVGRYNTIAGHFSKSGATPLVNQTRAQYRTGARAKSSKWSVHDFASWCAVWLLYLVEYADWNSQTKIGRGNVDSSSVQNVGATDSMAYHTGRASGTDGHTQVQYRHIESPWGNVWEWIDGANFNERAAYICTTPANYADDTASNYTAAGVTLASSGWITKLGMSSAFPWSFLPNTVGGSETTYVPDYLNSSTGWRVLMVGGDCGNSSNAGLFYFNASNTSGSTSSNIGARLLFHP